MLRADNPNASTLHVFFCFGEEEAAETAAFCGQILALYLLIDFLFVFFRDLKNRFVIFFVL